MRTVLRQSALWGLGIAVVWLAATAGLLHTYPHAWKSFALSTGNLSVATVILSPLCCAAGIAYGARLRRSGVVRTSHGWPRCALATIIALWIAGIGAVVIIAAFATTGIFALVAAGYPDSRFVVGPLLTALAVLASLTFGTVLGVTAGSYLLAVVGGVAVYALIARVPAVSNVLIGWSGPAAIDGTPDHLGWGAIALWAGLDFAVIVTSLLLVTIVTAPAAGHWWQWVCAGVLVAAVVVASMAVTKLENVWESSGDWRCREVGRHGSLACVSGDMSWRLEEYATAMGRVDNLLHASGAHRPLLYSPQGAPGQSGRMPVLMAVSTSSSPHEWATYLNQPLLADNMLGVTTSPTTQCDGAVGVLDDALASVMDGQRLDPSSLRSMVSSARACE